MVITLHLYVCMNLKADSKFALYVINRLIFITEVESVYSAVRTDSLYNAENFVLKGLNLT